MSKSTDPEHFFETDASQARRQRQAAKATNEFGNPMRMKSKINAAIADPLSSSLGIFIAESAGRVRRIDLENKIEVSSYKGPTAPVTSLAVGGKDNGLLFAGSWDKLVWSWDVATARPARTYAGHSDFVKAVVCATVADTPVLISGGADKKIMVFNIATGTRLHVLQDPTTTMLAVQHLAIDPLLSTPESLVLVSASSDPHIRRWKISLTAYEQLPEEYHERPGAERPTIQEHDTTVYKLAFDVASPDVDLLTASADGTAKTLSRARKFAAEDTFEHGDYVRAIVASENWVVSAGRDEHIKVWDRAEGTLRCTLEGHYDEVTDLVLLRGLRGEEVVCSVSIDGTIRTWGLGKEELDELVKEMEAWRAKGGDKVVDAEDEGKKEGKDGLMTAEEEAELAALMDED